MRELSEVVHIPPLPSEKELDEVVALTLQMSETYFFLNVPDERVSETSAEAAVVAERNEAYAEVGLCLSIIHMAFCIAMQCNARPPKLPRDDMRRCMLTQPGNM